MEGAAVQARPGPHGTTDAAAAAACGNPVSCAWAYRIDLHPEFQGWILCFATVTAVFFFCLPCYCAGLSLVPARRFAAWLNQRLPTFYCGMLIFNLVFIRFVIHWLPSWSMAQWAMALMRFFVGALNRLLECATSIAVIAVFCIAVAFKDRIAQLLGLDHQVIFKCKVRDCLSCWSTARFRPIELTIWKVEDLASADLFSANNVFVELFLGYNESMRTRVHNNAGSGCIIKEIMQLNFDEDDEDETLFIFVRNQKVMGTQELARAEIPTDRLKMMVRKAAAYGEKATTPAAREELRWSEEAFGEPVTLIPRGRLWLRATPVHDDDGGGFIQDLTTC